jgi:hypothetical protein
MSAKKRKSAKHSLRSDLIAALELVLSRLDSVSFFSVGGADRNLEWIRGVIGETIDVLRTGQDRSGKVDAIATARGNLAAVVDRGVTAYASEADVVQRDLFSGYRNGLSVGVPMGLTGDIKREMMYCLSKVSDAVAAIDRAAAKDRS